MKITGADLLIYILEKIGISTIAGIPGGSNLPLYNSLVNSNIRHILVRHEQSAGFIAQGIARVSKLPAVCFATSGPGATNLLTSLADANCDSIPVIAITGQVNSNLIGSNAFQEIDICAMAKPSVKKTFQVFCALDLLRIIPNAFEIALSGKPGPVLIDIPKDIQMEEIDIDIDNISIKNILQREYIQVPNINDSIEPILDIIIKSKKPVFYTGGGIIQSNSALDLRRFVNLHKIPVVSSLMGLGALEHDNPYFLGMLGMHGSILANKVLEESDLIITIGARFDDRATGEFKNFCPGSKIIHVDIEPLPEYKSRRIDHIWKSDAKLALEKLLATLPVINRTPWLNKIIEYRENKDVIENNTPEFICEIIRLTSDFTRRGDIITTDVGQHQMWIAQNFPFNHPGSFLTSGGLGTMGFGLPASIGAALASPNNTVICFTGDGSILMNIQELATLRELNLDIKIIIFNNRHLGLVRQQQHLFFNRQYFASKFDYSPDFVQIFKGFGIPGSTVVGDASSEQIYDKICLMFDIPGPYLLDIEVNPDHMVFPMVPPGRSNSEMLVSSSIID